MTNVVTLIIPLSSLFPLAFIAEHDINRCGTSLWSVGVGCPGHVPSQLLVHPSPRAGMEA